MVGVNCGVTSTGACYCHRQRKTTEIGEGKAYDYKHAAIQITSEGVVGPKLASSESELIGSRYHCHSQGSYLFHPSSPRTVRI